MMKAKPPQAGVTLISLFYGLGVVVLIGALFVGPDQVAAQIARAHGFPALAAHPVAFLLTVIGIGIAVIVGLSGMTLWGYHARLRGLSPGGTSVDAGGGRLPLGQLHLAAHRSRIPPTRAETVLRCSRLA